MHHEPDAVPVALAEFHRVLDAGGGLLVGAFAGAVLEPFDHAVTTAWRWPEERLVAAVEDAGFTVVDVREREDVGGAAAPGGQRGAGGVMSPAVAAGGRQGCQPGVARPVS